MNDYCIGSPYGWSKEDLIQYVVNKEDEINHKNTPDNPLPEVSYLPTVLKGVSLYNFLKSLMP